MIAIDCFFRDSGNDQPALSLLFQLSFPIPLIYTLDVNIHHGLPAAILQRRPNGRRRRTTPRNGISNLLNLQPTSPLATLQWPPSARAPRADLSTRPLRIHRVPLPARHRLHAPGTPGQEAHLNHFAAYMQAHLHRDRAPPCAQQVARLLAPCGPKRPAIF